MYEDTKVGDMVDVYDRSAPKWKGQRLSFRGFRSCEIVSILDESKGIVIVDTGEEYKIAMWSGSDDQVFRF